jgi:hypothetical protein
MPDMNWVNFGESAATLMVRWNSCRSRRGCSCWVEPHGAFEVILLVRLLEVVLDRA